VRPSMASGCWYRPSWTRAFSTAALLPRCGPGRWRWPLCPRLRPGRRHRRTRATVRTDPWRPRRFGTTRIAGGIRLGVLVLRGVRAPGWPAPGRAMASSLARLAIARFSAASSGPLIEVTAGRRSDVISLVEGDGGQLAAHLRLHGDGRVGFHVADDLDLDGTSFWEAVATGDGTSPAAPPRLPPFPPGARRGPRRWMRRRSSNRIRTGVTTR